MALNDQIFQTPLGSLTRATTAIARARSVKEVIETIRRTARSLVGCDGITVIRREGDLCRYVEEDAIEPLWKGQKFPAIACISGWAMINRQTVVVPDIAQDDRIPIELYAGTFVRALAMAPVRPSDPIGAIGAYWSQAYTPSRWEIETLEALAEAAAAAIENVDFIASLSDQLVNAKGTDPAGRQQFVDDFARDIEFVGNIDAVPIILDIVLRMTGMGFAAVARVTETKWITCQALDHVGFGLKPGDELPVETTLCNEIRDHRQPIVFDDAEVDPRYRDHHTPQIYGLRSYISMPIILANGTFFGTLCAIDSSPAKVNDPMVIGTFKLFAELIAHHLDAGERLQAAQESLERERELAELREQFIAILGHDLRNPLAAVDAGASRMLQEGWTNRTPAMLKLMKSSISRMAGLVDNLMDLARARLGGGITLTVFHGDLTDTLQHVVGELQVAHPERRISASFNFSSPVVADHPRIAQMFSNLVSNAVTHGSADKPIVITGITAEGAIEVCVSNGGRPIPKDRIDRLFMPFTGADGMAPAHGLGLGLYISSQIAKAHGGQIDVFSDEIETRFTFRMPMLVMDP
ncbi:MULTISPECIES: GAF domain-containing protein [unclassified Rhizobium]|uniref:sensor histidine kinase n=1 Tax=unclassified Rhizobium TaxID=2613769 RepID=UPI0016209D44|nr:MULTISPECIES: GAF domain-containing protein [unclassified Rhizobium]MBB3318251.1 signal transduction histidine kinase [Rhizobium sp. BK181]MCS4094056.1 signal transduction histidine kinase [Rhizobium sp. BK176]